MTFSSIFFSILTLCSFSFFFYSIQRKWAFINLLSSGKEENRSNNWILRLKDVVVEGLFQKRMYKDLSSAIMHLIIFWGFFIVSLGTLETILFGISPYFNLHQVLGNDSFLLNAYIISQDITNTLVLLAILYAISRRLFFPPNRLKTLTKASRVDAYIVLGAIGGLMLTAILYWGSKSFLEKEISGVFFSSIITKLFGFGINETKTWVTFNETAWWLHIFNLYGFMCFLPYSKHQHLIWVWANIFFKNHKGSGRIRPMSFDEDSESFGVGNVEEFTWKQMLDSLTCVECGRCTNVCPASNTGKKLDPRLIINEVKDAMVDASNNQKDKRKKLIGEIVSAEELWGCTTCGACMNACPLHIEHIPAIIDMRRYLTMTEGNMPPELQTTLQNLETQANPWGFNNKLRSDWAKGLGVKTMSETKGEVDYLFWVGCAGSFDERYKKVSRSIAKILNDSKVSFAILGNEETCNGDTARRAGNEYLADMQIKENIETFKRYKVKKVVTGCPHCFNTIKNEYPDFGLKIDEVIHHSELITQLSKAGKIRKKEKAIEKLTYHDSCYLGRHNDIYEEPRQAILNSNKNQKIIEMPRNKENGFCCGAGGARMWMEETEGERININRSKEAIKSGAKTIATACPFCMTMMRDGIAANNKKDEIEVKDIAEIIAEAE